MSAIRFEGRLATLWQNRKDRKADRPLVKTIDAGLKSKDVIRQYSAAEMIARIRQPETRAVYAETALKHDSGYVQARAEECLDNLEAPLRQALEPILKEQIEAVLYSRQKHDWQEWARVFTKMQHLNDPEQHRQYLADAMKHPYFFVVRSAVEGIRHVKDADLQIALIDHAYQTIPYGGYRHIVDAIHDSVQSDAQRCAYLAQGLARTHQDVPPALIAKSRDSRDLGTPEALTAYDQELRYAHARLVRGIHSAPLRAEWLSKLLDDPQKGVQEAAAGILARNTLAGPLKRPLLEKALDCLDAGGQRYYVLNELNTADLDDGDVAQVIEKVLAADRAPQVREAAAGLLMSVADDAVKAPLLLRALGDAEAPVRRKAVPVVAGIQDAALKALLMSVMLADTDPEVRAWATDNIRTIQNDALRFQLLSKLAESDVAQALSDSE